MTGRVSTAEVSKFLLTHEQFFSTAELSYAKALMKWLPYEKSDFPTVEYFEYLRNRMLKAHKQHAQFALDVFEECGVHYQTVVYVRLLRTYFIFK